MERGAGAREEEEEGGRGVLADRPERSADLISADVFHANSGDSLG